MLVSTPGSAWAGGVTWTARSAAEANDWRSVTYGNGTFVAVAISSTNRVMTSPDGITWTPRTAAEDNTWWGVTFGNGTFVAVAGDGTNRVMTSPYGITWTPRAATEANIWESVTYGNGTFVAIAATGDNRVMTSPDGITWTDRPAAAASFWIDVTYGNGTFVAVAATGDNRVMTSVPDAGFTLSTATVSVSETGSTATFTAVLDSPPPSDVVLSVTSADTDEATVDLATLTFTNGNWNTPQTVTVTGVDEALVDGDQATAITVAVVGGSSDDSYDALAAQTVMATTTDDETPGFSLSTTTATVSETGTTATFTVVLDAQPVSDVVFSVVSADTGEATVDKATLTFTNADWNSPQTVTVTGVDDGVVDGDQATAITVAVVDASSDDSYDALADQSVTATTTHDDAPPAPPGVRAFCATSGTIWGNPFSDLINRTRAFRRDVGCVYNSGVMRGTTTTTFSPDDTATREQAAVLIQRIMAVSGGMCASRVPPWSDLSSTSFAIGEISCLYGSGLINGTTATTFSPSAPVTRTETAALVARLYRYLSTNTCPTTPPPFTDTTGHWAADDIACVYGLGIDTGTTATTFSPDDMVTRADMATILARTIRTLL